MHFLDIMEIAGGAGLYTVSGFQFSVFGKMIPNYQ